MPPNVDASRSGKTPEVLYPGEAKTIDDDDLASLPSHIRLVRDGLLDFNGFIGLEAAMLVVGDEKSAEGDEDNIPLSAYKTDGLKESQRRREREFLENASEFAVGAQKLENIFAQNGEWRTLFRSVAKNRMDDAECFSPDQLSTIVCEENVRWDIDLDHSQSSLKNPTPDLCFGFPVHSTEHQKPSGFRYDSALKNFTVDTLLQLANEELRCVPVSRSLNCKIEIEKERKKLPLLALCFPWCTVHLKETRNENKTEKSDSSALEMSHKASATATIALTIFETLARFAAVKHDGRHVPPVITVTSIGANTTVWLAYCEIIDDKHREHKMIGIWNGCISKIWNAIQFCRILDNLFLWSQHILRPQLSQYIDSWRINWTPKVRDLHFRLEQDLETAELIHKIQHRLNSLGLSTNSHLPELIEQAVVLQEVMRPGLGKEKLSAKDSLDQNVRYEMKLLEKFPSHIASSLQKTAYREPIATGDTLGQRSALSKSSTAMDAALLPASSDITSTSEPVPKFKSLRDTNTGEKHREQSRFSYPYKIKTSHFEFESTSVRPERPIRSKALTSEEHYLSRSTITSLTPTNSFIAKPFQLSFHVEYWWGSTSISAPLRRQMWDAEHHPKPLAEPIFKSGEDQTERIERTEPPKRRKSGSQLAEITEPQSSEIKIPWKGERCITVRLPPAMPVTSPKPSL